MQRAHEETLVILKPDCIEKGMVGEVIKRFENANLKINSVKMEHMKRAVAKKFYKHVEEKAGKQVYNELVDFMSSNPILFLVIGGENSIAEVRKLTGISDPAKAPPGTIRGDFGTDSTEIADREKRAVRNLIHSSGNITEAENELALFFK